MPPQNKFYVKTDIGNKFVEENQGDQKVFRSFYGQASDDSMGQEDNMLVRWIKSVIPKAMMMKSSLPIHQDLNVKHLREDYYTKNGTGDPYHIKRFIDQNTSRTSPKFKHKLIKSNLTPDFSIEQVNNDNDTVENLMQIRPQKEPTRFPEMRMRAALPSQAFAGGVLSSDFGVQVITGASIIIIVAFVFNALTKRKGTNDNEQDNVKKKRQCQNFQALWKGGQNNRSNKTMMSTSTFALSMPRRILQILCVECLLKRVIKTSFILSIGSLLLLANYSSFWVTIRGTTLAYYNAYTNQMMEFRISVYIGLSGFNVTLVLIDDAHTNLNEWHNATNDSQGINSKRPFILNVFQITSSADVNSSKISENQVKANKMRASQQSTKFVQSNNRPIKMSKPNQSIRVVKRSPPSTKGNNTNNPYFILNISPVVKKAQSKDIFTQTTSKIVGDLKLLSPQHSPISKGSEPFPNITKKINNTEKEKTLEKLYKNRYLANKLTKSVDINFNEQFLWDSPLSAGINRGTRKNYKRLGFPFPITDVAEIMYANAKSFIWASYYARYFSWWALTSWILSLVLFNIMLCAGGYAFITTGAFMCLSSALYFYYLRFLFKSNGPISPFIHFNHMINDKGGSNIYNGYSQVALGASFWINTVTAVSALVAGVYVVALVKTGSHSPVFNREKIQSSFRRVKHLTRPRHEQHLAQRKMEKETRRQSLEVALERAAAKKGARRFSEPGYVREARDDWIFEGFGKFEERNGLHNIMHYQHHNIKNNNYMNRNYKINRDLGHNNLHNVRSCRRQTDPVTNVNGYNYYNPKR